MKINIKLFEQKKKNKKSFHSTVLSKKNVVENRPGKSSFF